MELMRLIVTGTVGAGKSTLVRSVSEIEVVDTDRQTTDKTSSVKEKTTIALDFGRLNFGPDMAVHLYGTPGHARFDFMWDLLIQRAHAYILLVAADRPGDFRQARQLLAFMEQRVQIPVVIGLTHTDCPGAWSKKDVAIALGYANKIKRPPIVIVNPAEKASVVQALITLVNQFNSKKSAAFSKKRSKAA
ncbi:GTPase [Funiculus sociatus GB2-A5]|jgi:hypothetical protein|uniref:GTPase n=1 Tax=Funiculus sociatus GB2-A5 TaxID=2933946 RepID=A0ABV0JRE8_9CYAN|nr:MULTISPECIES: GTPase [unclassified Trichocoleus]MBD1906161.1 GTPase [Trichocoleus sp. FACHB-832]MBD2006148.1 GTPase [Trichocoleus sp. FACHB-40]MBD2061217.1 GTPase [Trichocoleus sp. FACHB-6]